MDSPQPRPGPDWGLGHYERTAQALLPAAQVLVQAADLAPGERVVDLGSGTGNAALLAAAAGAEVTAVDPAPRLLSVAAEAARAQGLTLTCVDADAGAIPLPDRDVDCVLSNFGIVFAPDPSVAIAETVRVLRPDGRALFTAWLPGGALGALAALAQELVLAVAGAPPPSPGLPWHDEAAVDQLFAEHGWTVDEVDRQELVFTAASPAAYLDAELQNHPLAMAGFQLLQAAGQADQAREQLLRLLRERNEDESAYRATSQYVVLRARPG